MGGDTDKIEPPAKAPPPIVSSTPAGPAFDLGSLLQTPTAGNSLAALGSAPLPAAMLASPSFAWRAAPLVSLPAQPKLGTFVLDPSIADAATPRDTLTTHVRVEPAYAAGVTEAARFVVIERPVRAALRLDVYAVRLDDVYDTMMEAYATRPMIAVRTSPLPTIIPGETYWTPAGAITALGASGDAVFTVAPNGDTGAAGSVILLQTDAGPVLIDVGIQAPDARLAPAVGDELAREVAATIGSTPIGEAILSRRPPDGHVTPYIGKLVQILTVRATLDQYQDGSVGAVLAVQNQYRDWYLAALREQVLAERATWEAQQPIAPNDSIREQRWQQHLEATLASALRGYQPPALAVAEDVGGILEPSDDAEPLQPPPLTRDATGAVDLTATDWESADDEQIAILAGNKLAVVPARGILWRPASVPMGPPSPRSVPELRAPGPLGPGPAAPRAVTPWAYLSAIGKEGQMLVRISAGHGVLVDAGGVPRVVSMAGLAAAQGTLGVGIDKILITHPHTDHVRHVIDLIRQFHIDAKDLIVSKAWEGIGLIKELKNTTDQDLLDLHYGKDWEPIQPGTGNVARLSTTVDGRRIDIYALPDEHSKLADTIASRASRKASGKKSSKVPSEWFDSASFLYVLPNESSAARTAVFGDLRGADILKLRDGLTADGFKAALKDVTVVQGLGHHLSQSAGQDAEDVRGLDVLIEATLHQNGRLTLLVQSSEAFAFAGAPTTVGKPGALLNYLVRQGVRVVFAGRAGETPSAAVVDSAGGVAPTGPAVRVFDTADPRVTEMYDRLELLREAQKTVRESPEFGPRALGMKDRSAAEIDAALQTEIDALLGAARELRDLAGVDLLRARGTPREQAKYRDPSAAPGRTEAQILDAMATKGPVETGLAPEVITRLRESVMSGRSISLYAEFGAMPRAVYDAIEQLSDPDQKKALAEKYRELQDLTGKLQDDLVPDADRLTILERVKELRLEVENTIAKVGAHDALQAELARLDSAIAKLEAQTETVNERFGRDIEGRVTRTRYIKVRDAVMRGADALGRGMGALMVVHSIQEAAGTLQRAAQGDAGLPEVALGLTHSLYGMNIGMRMVRGVHVGAGEFGVMTILEVGMAAAGEYDTRAERAEATTNAAIRGAANLGCMLIGQDVMEIAVGLPPPFDLIGFGLGLAITFAGDWLLELFGFREHQEKPPEAVTDVGKKIDAVMTEYKAILGSEQLAARPDYDLEALGVKDPQAFHKRAEDAADAHARAVASKEWELTLQFEEGYRAAKGSWFGLQHLDQKAAEFTKLRAAAMHGRSDPWRDALDTRWRAMDTNVAFKPDDETWKMDQWDELDRKVKKIRDMLAEQGMNVDRKKLAEAVTAADGMLENARYRIDSQSRGGFRPAPVLDDSATSAKQLYMTKLEFYEQQLAGFHRQLVMLAGGQDVLSADATMQPGTAYDRLRLIRAEYELRVEQVAALMPQLANPATWASPETLTHALEPLHITHEAQFAELQLLDASLQAASHQATASLQLPSANADATLKQLIESEVKAATQAIETRRYKRGLVFDGELDAINAEQGEAEDKVFATQLDVAFIERNPNAPKGPAPSPFNELELAALHGGTFDTSESKLTSTEAQLTHLRETQAAMKGKLMFTNRFTDRNYFTLDSPYRQWDDDAWFKNVDTHEYPSNLHPIVVELEMELQLGSLVYGVFYQVFPVNADAVAILGTNKVKINGRDLTPFPHSMIVELAKQRGKQ